MKKKRNINLINLLKDRISIKEIKGFNNMKKGKFNLNFKKYFIW